MNSSMFVDIQEGLLLVFYPIVGVFIAMVAAGGVFASVLSFFLETFSRNHET